MKNRRDLSFLNLTLKQQKALEKRRKESQRKSEEFLAARRAARIKSAGPLEASLSPKAKLLVVQNTGTKDSFVTFDREHALQAKAFFNSPEFDVLITQVPSGKTAALSVVDDSEDQDQDQDQDQE